MAQQIAVLVTPVWATSTAAEAGCSVASHTAAASGAKNDPRANVRKLGMRSTCLQCDEVKEVFLAF